VSREWRIWTVPFIAGLAGIALSVIVWRVLENAEQQNIESALKADAEGVLLSIEREFATAHETVMALGAFFGASRNVNESEFRRFTSRLLADGRHPEIEVFLWVGVDQDQTPQRFANSAKSPPGGTVFDATERELAAFKQPPEGDALRVLAPRDGIVFVYGRANSEKQAGAVAARLNVNRISVTAMTGFSRKSLHVSLTDVSGDKHVRISGNIPQGGLPPSRILLVAGDNIKVQAIAGPQYEESRRTAGPLVVLFAMLFATALSIGYVWIAQTRTARIARLVDERTATVREVTHLQQAIVTSANYAIITFDPLGRILTFNPAAESMLGHRAEHVIGGMSPVAFHDPADLAKHSKAMGVEPGLEAIVGLAGHGDAVGWTYRRADGSTLPVSLSVSALWDETDEITGYLAIVHDISTRLAAEEELRHAKSQAEAASRIKSRFLANMSHELRTPLTAILGYSEMLAEDAAAADEAESERDLRRIHDSGRHLLRLIDDVLDLSKVEAGRIVLEPQDIDVPRLIEEVATTVRPLAESHGNELLVTSPPAVIVSDPTRLRQVLFNLVANAARFTENGKITLDAECTATEAVFVVRDSGIGMSAEDLERVFEPFVQADGTSTRKVGGTGLGLAIARQLTELMGGSLTATSTPGSGSEFRVCIPVEQA